MKNHNSSTLTRRSFLTAAVAGAGLASVGALAGCSSPLANTDSAAEDVAWSKEADIIVVGFGAAGGGAAAEASAHGLEVLVLEKMDEAQAGGSSTCFANAWFPVASASLVDNSYGEMPQDVAAAREAASMEAMALMDGYGMKMLPTGYEIEGGSKKFYEIMSTSVKGLDGVEVMYETPVMGLVQNTETGEVQGVRATQNGADVFIKARKGVIVTTGGYEGNYDLVHTLHQPLVPLATIGGPAHTGEGLMMCMEAGCAIENLPKGLDWYEFAYRKASEEAGTALTYRWYSTDQLLTGGMGEPFQYDSHIFVDMTGNRFMNELTYITHNKSQLEFTAFAGGMFDNPRGYKHMPFFMVFDEAMMTGGPLGKVDQDHTPWTWNGVHDVYAWSDDNQAELQKGWIIKGDTLDDLAAQMKSNDYWTGAEMTMDAEGLKAAVKKYNDGIAAGADEFGRTTGLNPIAEEGPYYAIELCPCTLYTMSGPVNDINGQVIDLAGNPIPRLFCAGNVGQSQAITPIGVCACMGNGILAGRYAATLDDWA